MSVLADNADRAHDNTNGHHRSSAVPDLPSDPATAYRCDLHVETGPAGTILIMRLAGDIDLISYPQVHTALLVALHHTPHDLVIDLAGVGFCCVRGFALLADAAHLARAAGIGFALSGLSRHLDRITTLLWPAEPFLRYPNTIAALTALHIAHAHRPPDITAPGQ